MVLITCWNYDGGKRFTHIDVNQRSGFKNTEQAQRIWEKKEKKERSSGLQDSQVSFSRNQPVSFLANSTQSISYSILYFSGCLKVRAGDRGGAEVEQWSGGGRKVIGEIQRDEEETMTL